MAAAGSSDGTDAIAGNEGAQRDDSEGKDGRVSEVRRRSFAANVAANAGGKFVGLALALGISPFIIYHLGLAAFGFWALVASLTGYAGLLDFGAGAALTKFIAEHDALGDRAAMVRKSTAAAAITRVMGGFVASLALVFVLLVPEGWSDGWPPGWEWAVLGAGFGLICILSSSVWLAFPRGLGRWDLQALPLLAYQVVFGAGALIVLPLGLGIGGLGLATALAGVTLALTSRHVCARVWSERVRARGAERDEVESLLRYGANLQAGALATVFMAQADKPMILIAGGSLAFVGIYELASRVAFQVRTLPITVLGPLTAKVSADVAGKDRDAVRDFYGRALPLVTALGVGPLLFVYGFCYPLTLAWLGSAYADTALIVCVLGSAYAINFVTGAGSAVANGAGRPQLERNYTLAALALNVLLSVALGLAFGPWGVIAASAISLSIASAWFLGLVDRWLGLPSGWSLAHLVAAWRPLALGIGLGALGPLTATRYDDAGRLGWLLIGAGGLALSATIYWRFVPEVRHLRRRSGT